jgi:hypothetical protein
MAIIYGNWEKDPEYRKTLPYDFFWNFDPAEQLMYD